MRYRPLLVADLPLVGHLYHQMLVEAYRTSSIHYPRWDATTPAQMVQHLYYQLVPPKPQCPHCQGELKETREGGFVSCVAVLGNRPKGLALGEVYVRPIGTPRLVAHCSLLYVEPKSRGRRGSKGVGPRLLQAMAAESERRFPGAVFEGSFVPGTHGARLWPRLGLQPYVTYCAFVDKAGEPRKAAELFEHRNTAARSATVHDIVRGHR